MRKEIPVSIILATYNRAALLPRSIESVLGQTYGDFELIIVDEGQDETAAEVAKFSDERIRYFKLSPRRGLAGARNVGLAQARGEYIAFQDDDDEWLPEKLERQTREFAAHPSATVVYGDMLRMCADGRILYFRSPTIARGQLLNPQTGYWQSYMLAMQPALMRRCCFDTHRFDERLTMFEDLDLYLRVAQRHEFLRIQEPLVKYYETFGMTCDRLAELKGRRQLLQKYGRALLSTDPAFLFRESANIFLRRSLMPIVNLHLTPL